MTTELERYEPPAAKTPDLDSWIAVISDVSKLSVHIADTDFVPQALRGNAAAVAAAILSGREAGVGPMASLQNINVVKGKPGQSALLMRQLVFAAGHQIRYLETTDTRCVVEGRRRGGERWEKVTFTADQARRARIDLGGYPEDKLVARATTRLCRRLFPDAIGGMPYSFEELEDGDDLVEAATPTPSAEAAQPAAEPAKRTAQRKTRTPRPAPSAAPTAPPEPAEDQPPLPGEPGYDDDTPAGEDTRAAAKEDDRMAQAEAEWEEQVAPGHYADATPAQLRKLHTVFGKHKVKDRDARISLAAKILGHDVDSTKTLSIREASVVIDALARLDAVDGDDLDDIVNRIAIAVAKAQLGATEVDYDLDTGEEIHKDGAP